jgi:ABC-type glycerol-3-phosphate transport system substrate-binding protein
MPTMKIRRPLIAVLAAAAIAMTGCAGQAGSKAGGASAPVTLQFANLAAHLDYLPAVEDFITRVGDLSGGTLRIEVSHEWGNFSTDAEERVVRDVAAGKPTSAGSGQGPSTTSE